jgi:hypothetical protein
MSTEAKGTAVRELCTSSGPSTRPSCQASRPGPNETIRETREMPSPSSGAGGTARRCQVAPASCEAYSCGPQPRQCSDTE